MTDIKQIAERLSGPVRLNLFAIPREPIMCDDFENHSLATVLLIHNGLVDFYRKWWLFGPKMLCLTTEGLAVRTYLLEKADG